MRFRFGECVVDDQARELYRCGEQVHITPKAFELLTMLLRERPRAVPKSELQDRLWPSTFVAESNLPTLINEVRSAVGDTGRNGRHLRTVHGFGYAFCGTAEDLELEPASGGSIAIFPFEHANEPELAYLAQGLPESLINAFSRFREFRVTPRSTAFRLGHLAGDPAALRTHLNVRWAVTGRVASIAQDVIVQVEVVDTSTGAQVWGDRFRKDSGQMASLDQQIAGEIASALSVQLTRQQQQTIDVPQTENSRAYVMYLKGRFHWNRRTRDSLQRAVECFREAIQLDARYVLPRVGLADAFIAIGTRDLVDPRQAFSQAEHHANVALKLDPLLAEAHTALAAIDELHHWNWERAESRYQKAIELKPGYATAMQWYALHLARRLRHEEARQQIERAAGIDPLSLIIVTNRGLVAYLRRDYEAALHIFDGALELEPNYEGALFGRALTLGCIGDHEDSCRVFERLRLASDDPHVLAFHAHALARAGRLGESRELIDRLELLGRERFVSGSLLAVALMGSGQSDKALDRLEEGVEQRSAWMVYLLTEPRLDALRDHRRFHQVLKRVNLPATAGLA